MADLSDKDEDKQDLITARHRKEKKDLQAKIQALKKTASKGDKKKRKEVLEEIAKLEIDLEKKQTQELSEPILERKAQPSSQDAAEEISSVQEPKQKISKAQKRRDKKALEKKQRDEEIAASYENNKDDPRRDEMKTLKEVLKKRGLCLHSIASDGNCLYNAVKHQLEITGRPIYDISHLRNEAANYILNNKDSLICYMTNTETGNLLSEEEFTEYCEAVRNTAAWGGQVEIRALSNILKAPIEVLQAYAPSTLQGVDDYPGSNLVITYHRHMYSLGEHYNSTKPALDGGEEQGSHEDEKCDNETNANLAS